MLVDRDIRRNSWFKIVRVASCARCFRQVARRRRNVDKMAASLLRADQTDRTVIVAAADGGAVVSRARVCFCVLRFDSL